MKTKPTNKLRPKNEPAVTVRNLYKSFKIPLEGSSGIKQKTINLFKGKSGYREFTPLKDVSFTINKGDFFGIVGRNGSGKSTLLKTIAGIYQPNKGNVQVNGSLVPFIELGVGFNPELTGKENVYLNGALLGFSRQEIRKMYKEIVDFAELGDFMEERLKNYSSGMQVRLAFSIAIRAQSDILLLDEVLAVGDANFQAKCLSYFHELKKKKRTVIFISHDMNAVQEFCNKVMVIDKGRAIFNGDPREAASLYNMASFETQGAKEVVKDGVKHRGLGDVQITSLKAKHSDGKKIVKLLKPNEDFTIELIAKTEKKVEDLLIGVQIIDASGGVMFSTNNKKEREQFKKIKSGSKIVYSVSLKNIFNDGAYTLAAALKTYDRSKTYDEIHDVGKFNVAGWDVGGGVHIDHTKKIEIL